MNCGLQRAYQILTGGVHLPRLVFPVTTINKALQEFSMRKSLIRVFSRVSVLAMLALPAPVVLADRANGEPLQEVNAEMLRIAEAFLATVAETGGIEAAVGYNRRELVALEHDDPARTNYVYW